MIEVSLAAALAMGLSFLILFRMPYGGSVSLEMVPLVLIAFRRGGKWGIAAGALFGLLKLLIDPFIVHPLQVLLDYPIPFLLIGVAGFFPKKMVFGVLLGSFGRYVSHVLSGVVFWGMYAPEDMSPWLYSITYNASYWIPETIIVIGVIFALRRRRDLFEPRI